MGGHKCLERKLEGGHEFFHSQFQNVGSHKMTSDHCTDQIIVHL